MMTGADDGVLRVWDLRSNEIVKSIETGSSTINDLELAYDNNTVAIAAGKKYSF